LIIFKGVTASFLLNMSVKGLPKFEMSFFVLERTGPVLFSSLQSIFTKKAIFWVWVF
jgi:hypothetical protein